VKRAEGQPEPEPANFGTVTLISPLVIQ